MGLIPAHAGKTVAAASSWGWQGAHPRSRGENSTEAPLTSSVMGSSPLTRGKRVVMTAFIEGSGLIPAHAGKTECCGRMVPNQRAHPRSRGENRGVTMHALRHSGSSPLTRGKRIQVRRRPNEGRLIPAHAGKTETAEGIEIEARAHPRSRGENDSLPGCTTGWEGSSPLTRGKHEEVRGRHGLRGLIPAHAGKTFQAELEMIRDRAHPRSRGENRSMAVAFSASSGSSPLTRGKPARCHHRPRHIGLIPAHAGKTTRPATPASPSWAHPRSRGENVT